MKRKRINLLAIVTILVGSWVLSYPAPATASASMACCRSGDGEKECCGRLCRASADSCDACDDGNC